MKELDSTERYYTAATLYEQSKSLHLGLPARRLNCSILTPRSSIKHPVKRPFQHEEILQCACLLPLILFPNKRTIQDIFGTYVD